MEVASVAQTAWLFLVTLSVGELFSPPRSMPSGSGTWCDGSFRFLEHLSEHTAKCSLALELAAWGPCLSAACTD
eukprot:5957323-Amphidinium_carterae.1